MPKRVFAVLLALAVVIVACSPTSGQPAESATPAPSASTAGPTVSAATTAVPTTAPLPGPTAFTDLQLLLPIVPRSFPAVCHHPLALAALGERIYVANRATNNVAVLESERFVRAIDVGEAPVTVVADPTTGSVYVANELDDTISIITQDGVVYTVPTIKTPRALAAWNGRLYVGGDADVIQVLDGRSGAKITEIEVEASIGVFALSISPVSQLLYVSVYDAVQIINLADRTLVKRLYQSVYTTLAADPVTERFFVGYYDSTSGKQYLIAYDKLAQRELGRALLGSDPRGIAFSSDGATIYVANSYSNSVSVIDATRLDTVAEITVGAEPQAVAVSHDGRVYVANAQDDSVAVIDAMRRTLARTVPLALLLRSAVVHPMTGCLYVASTNTNSVFFMDGETLLAEVKVGVGPREVALSVDGETLFVLNYVSGDLSIVSTEERQVVDTIPIGRWPQGLGVAPDQQLYAGGIVLDLNTRRPLRKIELLTGYGTPVYPVRTALFPELGRVFITAANGVPGSNSGLVVYVLDLESGKRIAGTVGGLSMTGLEIDPAQQRVYSTFGRYGYYQLAVDNAQSLQRLAALNLSKYPAALGLNPRTAHLFICLTQTPNPEIYPGIELLVLDTRSLGVVARFSLPGNPDYTYTTAYSMAIDQERNVLYLVDGQLGLIHVLRDVQLPAPPSPTPTFTPTPWPTETTQPGPSRTPVPTEVICTTLPGPPFLDVWAQDRFVRARLACPLSSPGSGFTAEQSFERGLMIWREQDRSILVFYDNGSWVAFSDSWREGMNEYACSAEPPAGLQQPKRGFGLLWCQQEGVREGLGWATRAEQGITNQWQLFGGGEMITSGLRREVYALFTDRTFARYPSP